MILGTHNSATSGRLVWWQRPFGWLLHLTSRCQDRTIEQQLLDGVRLFNLQVCYYKGEWHISHGLCIYETKLMDVLDTLKTCEERVIFQLYFDKSFWVEQNEEEFVKLVGEVKRKYCSPRFILQKAWVEGTNKFPHKTSYKLSIEERYWTKDWAEKLAKQWCEKLPLPQMHAEKYNKTYKADCKSEYLMLDFYEK